MAPPLMPRPMYQAAAPQARPARRSNPLLALAIIVALAAIMGGVFFVTRDNNKGGDGGPIGGASQRSGETPPQVPGTAPGATPVATPAAPAVIDGPIIAPGYKMTAIYVPPTGSNDMRGLERRLFDGIVAGVNWNDSAKLFGRRYPLQYVFQNATTNLLLKPPNPDEARKLFAAAGYPNEKPKFLLSFNASDNVFGSWLGQQINGLGFNVVTDANSFTPQEKARGYHGIIIAILPA
jgi:hypothetical protein